MGKLTLANGSSFKTLNSIANYKDDSDEMILEIRIIPNTSDTDASINIEDLLKTFTGNYKIEHTETNEDGSQTYNSWDNYQTCKSISIYPKEYVGFDYVCPSCGEVVTSESKQCPKCEATFESPNMEDRCENVCVIKLVMDTLHTRIKNIESAVETIVGTILSQEEL